MVVPSLNNKSRNGQFPSSQCPLTHNLSTIHHKYPHTSSHVHIQTLKSILIGFDVAKCAAQLLYGPVLVSNCLYLLQQISHIHDKNCRLSKLKLNVKGKIWRRNKYEKIRENCHKSFMFIYWRVFSWKSFAVVCLLSGMLNRVSFTFQNWTKFSRPQSSTKSEPRVCILFVPTFLILFIVSVLSNFLGNSPTESSHRQQRNQTTGMLHFVIWTTDLQESVQGGETRSSTFSVCTRV